MHWLTVTTCKSVGYTHGVELLGQQTCFRRYGSFPEWLCQFILSKVCEGYSCYPTFRILGLISTYGRYEALSCVFFCSFLSVIKWSAFSYVEQIFGYLLLWRAHLRLLQIFFFYWFDHLFLTNMWELCIYMLDINPLLDIVMANIFC